MKKILQALSIGLVASSFTLAANAMEIVFDGPLGPDTVAPSISFGDLTVTAGYSSSNLCCDTDFNISNITGAEVWQDTDSPDAGLGVKSGLPNDTDNFEGSLGGPNSDEVLFFDFGSVINLLQVTLNAGDNGGHQDLFDAQATDVFDIFLSNDNGTSYTSIFQMNTAPTAGELLTLPGSGVVGQYFAVAHVGPTAANGSVGGYIEKIQYASVPEPGTLALLGLGLAGLGLSRKRKQA
jgi:hypothetical protein